MRKKEKEKKMDLYKESIKKKNYEMKVKKKEKSKNKR